MTTMINVEVRRCLARRLVRWLIILAVLGCVLAGVIAERGSGPAGAADRFRLTELWAPEGDAILGIAAFFLLIGAVVGGASMVGAEWRAGTLVTLLTWQPNRARVAVAKLTACGLVAGGVAVALQVVFGAAFLPAALGPGTTEGVDLDWFGSLAGAVARVAIATGLAAVLMASIAMIGRNTAAALGIAFGYLLLVENLVRAWKPWAGRFLLGENGAIFVSGQNLDTELWARSTTTAGLTLAGITALVAVLAVLTFHQRDLAATT